MNGENKMETVEVKHENLQELYKVLTNYPAISKEQVIHELHKCFGKEAFKLKDVTERIKTFEDACKELGENNPLILSILLNGRYITPEIALQKKTILIQRQQMRISILTGISHGIIQRSTDAYIPAASPVLQAFRMTDIRQRQSLLPVSGRIIP